MKSRIRVLPAAGALIGAVVVVAGAFAFAFALASGASAQTPPPQTPALGPVDGHDLPATDLERVAAGTEAPLFALESYGGGTVALADYRGSQNVVLVFYRGHW